MRRYVLSLCAVIWCVMPASAHEYLIGDLAIVHPHAHPSTPEGDVIGGYMELFNGSNTPERLLAVRTGIADVSFFDPAAEGGNGQRVANAIEIAPGQSVFLGPEALQIRFAGLQEALRIGDKFLVTLVFEQVGPVTVEFWVEGRSGAVPVPAALPEKVSTTDADPEAIAGYMRSRLGPQTKIAALAVSESAAVVGWIGPKEAGRAFLRRTGQDWRLLLLSGESLIDIAALRAQGLSPSAAQDLLREITLSEADLSPVTLAQLNSFRGTLIVTAE